MKIWRFKIHLFNAPIVKLVCRSYKNNISRMPPAIPFVDLPHKTNPNEKPFN